MEIRSETLKNQLAEPRPKQVYHYTSPSGLIGIFKNEEIWATNIRYLNDFNELYEASNAAERILNDMLSSTSGSETDLLNKMSKNVGAAASRYYVSSFSKDGDSLSQWRAYCPPTGGYALGIPSAQLVALAEEKEWLFVKCVYAPSKRDSIIREVIEDFLKQYRDGLIDDGYLNELNFSDLNEYRLNIASRFQLYIAKIGGIIKNNAFKDEQEWRLISPSIIEDDKNIDFRDGASCVVPYYKFPLKTENNPNLVQFGDDELKLIVGPTPQMNNEAKQAAQYILTKYLGISKGHILSEIPYRVW